MASFNFKVAELRELAEKNNIEGYATMKKADLEKALRDILDEKVDYKVMEKETRKIQKDADKIVSDETKLWRDQAKKLTMLYKKKLAEIKSLEGTEEYEKQMGEQVRWFGKDFEALEKKSKKAISDAKKKANAYIPKAYMELIRKFLEM